jgi:Protein of unknown function (DUF1376)
VTSSKRPLVPAEVDLRDFPYMPLDVVRLRDSNLAGLSNGEAFRAAVLLWCAAWHQIPAASLPNDDRMLARLAGFGRDLDAWRAVKDEALWHFEECYDNRLYHPVIAEKAIEAWTLKQKRREQTAAALAARKQKQGLNEESDMRRNIRRNVASNVGTDVARNVHQGNRIEGNRKKNNRNARTRADFSAFWQSYPHKVGKPAAIRAFGKASAGASLAEILDGLERYKHAKPADRPWLNPATFLNQERWADQPACVGGNGANGATGPPVADNRVLIAEDSPEFAAWSRYRGKKLPTYQTDKRDDHGQRIVGRYEDSRWPPDHESKHA